MCINHMIRDALTNKQPNPRYAFISPTFKQGKSTAWDYIKNFAKNNLDVMSDVTRAASYAVNKKYNKQIENDKNK